ncbi:magnesium/cobalt transporter CorA [Thalassoroseus pseudoceratinae]|uniref:magnesium/cobalt transporter CorA n=1 Tax=Thalassoroseus pseudoceratinae TaxID=2713176 RepID=UPI001423946D|nr:magnesium/cobalt transporter CorA [Thalassoroseus pseudoceratinae]
MPVREGLLRTVYRPFRRRTKPGSVPGTIQHDPTLPPTVCDIVAFGSDGIEERREATLNDIQELSDRFAVCWVNVVGLGTADMIKKIGEFHKIHPLALEDVVNTHQQAKVEEYEGQLFIVVRMAKLEPRLWTEQVSLLVGKKFVVTFQEQAGDCFDTVRQRIRKGTGRIRSRGSDYLAYMLIDAVLDDYFPVLERYGVDLDALEERLLSGQSHNVIPETHRLRSEILQLRRTIWPHRDAVNVLIRDEHPLIQTDTKTYLRDCYDHIAQLSDVADTYRDLGAGLRELQFSLDSQRTNEVMKVLTVIATIFMPLGFIAGVYGMNFDPDTSPWNMPELEWAYGYPFAITLMLGIAISLLMFFRHKGWLGNSNS